MSSCPRQPTQTTINHYLARHYSAWLSSARWRDALLNKNEFCLLAVCPKPKSLELLLDLQDLFLLPTQSHEKRTTKTSRKGTNMSYDGLTPGKINFWIHSKSSFTSPATCFECYDGTVKEMGGRRFQLWVGCILCPLKKSIDFSSVIGSRQILYLWFLFEQS